MSSMSISVHVETLNLNKHMACTTRSRQTYGMYYKDVYMACTTRTTKHNHRIFSQGHAWACMSRSLFSLQDAETPLKSCTHFQWKRMKDRYDIINYTQHAQAKQHYFERNEWADNKSTCIAMHACIIQLYWQFALRCSIDDRLVADWKQWWSRNKYSMYVCMCVCTYVHVCVCMLNDGWLLLSKILTEMPPVLASRRPRV